jgi:hypothetical protein
MMRGRFPLTAPDLAFLPAMTGCPEWWESTFIEIMLSARKALATFYT